MATNAPLVVLFERDDAIAVPLLSQLRMAGYDVRSSRTPVELFDILSKHLVSLVLVDLGNATASRREFWVALDAQRRGRAIQVMTFRYIEPASLYDTDFEPAGRALADVEVHGAHEFQAVIDGVRQRIPFSGSAGASSPQAFSSMPGLSGVPGMPGMPGAPSMPGMSQPSYAGGIPPIGAALGIPSPFMQSAPNGGAPSTPPVYDSNPFGVAPGFDPQHQYGQQAAYGAVNAAAYPGRPMPPVYPYAQAPAGQQEAPYPPAFGAPAMAGMQPSPLSPFPQSPIPPNPYTPPPNPYIHPAQPNFAAPPYGAETPASQFANPAASNPFAHEIEASPFAQPLNANPFASDVPGSGNSGQPEQASPFATPQWSRPDAPAAVNPFGDPGNDLMQPFAGGGQPSSFGAFSPPFGMSRSGTAGTAGAQSDPSWPGLRQQPKPPISDVWTPPDSDGEYFQQTSVVPEIPRQERPDRSEPDVQQPEPATEQHLWQARTQAPEPLTDRDTQQDTAPVPAPAPPPASSNLPAVRQTETERALGSVLVEGALLTEQRLEVLKGIQQMLGSVNMEFKLGELALLFKFLSPDQLLAALLVSRGLVSPQQIAGLGRVKQELSSSGMDYDLETLLQMFHIMPGEQLHRLRAELA